MCDGFRERTDEEGVEFGHGAHADQKDSWQRQEADRQGAWEKEGAREGGRERERGEKERKLRQGGAIWFVSW